MMKAVGWKRYGILSLLAAMLLLFGSSVFRHYRERRTPSPPYSDSFAQKKVAEWMPYGGLWWLDGNTVMSHSTERGSKLITGSSDWRDYQVTADVQLRGYGGDLGLAVRVKEAHLGIDAYSGYFAGVRFDNSSLTIGRSDGHWIAGQPVYVQGGVHYNEWYRLHIVVVGCKIAAELISSTTHSTTISALDDTGRECIQAGGIALRTTDSNGAWRNIHVESATESDLARLVKGHAFDTPRFPLRERDYSAMQEAYLATVPPQDIHTTASGREDIAMSLVDGPIVKVDELRAHLWNKLPVKVVGVITSSDPMYIQDSTGGVRMRVRERATSLQVGNEIEVLGLPTSGNGELLLTAIDTRILWDLAPIIATPTTSTEAAAGHYNGSLIELSGLLRRRQKMKDGKQELLMQDGSQSYVVQLPFDVFNTSIENLETGSRLKVRGICSMTGARSWTDASAFLLLAGASSDVTLLAGPPWWAGKRLAWLFCGFVVLIVLALYLFVAIERLKLRIVHDERERLSHEMHDTLAQSLAGVGFKLQGILRTMRQAGSIPESILEEVRSTCTMVAGTHREASASIAALHPSSKTEGELLTLLERFVFSMVNTADIEVSTEQSGERQQLSPIVADTLLRVGKEALANTLRHAKATHIRLSVLYRSRNLVLSIADNGVGFLYVADKRGFGLKSIQTRCSSIKAQVEICSSPESGTIVRITSPYRLHRLLARWFNSSFNHQF